MFKFSSVSFRLRPLRAVAVGFIPACMHMKKIFFRATVPCTVPLRSASTVHYTSVTRDLLPFVLQRLMQSPVKWRKEVFKQDSVPHRSGPSVPQLSDRLHDALWPCCKTCLGAKHAGVALTAQAAWALCAHLPEVDSEWMPSQRCSYVMMEMTAGLAVLASQLKKLWIFLTAPNQEGSTVLGTDDSAPSIAGCTSPLALPTGRPKARWREGSPSSFCDAISRLITSCWPSSRTSSPPGSSEHY